MMKDDTLPVMPTVQKTKPIYIVWSNTDLTEGKGQIIPIFVCWSIFTAKRMAEGQGVQGCNADVAGDMAMFVDGRWRVPGSILTPNADDERQEKLLLKHETAVKKAKAAGLTDEDITNLNWISLL